MQLGKVMEVPKPTVISFKHKDDTDLFGLGIQDEAEAVTKDSSEDQEGKMTNIPDTQPRTQNNFRSTVYCLCRLLHKLAFIPISEKESKQPFKEKKKKKKSKEVKSLVFYILSLFSSHSIVQT